MDIIRHPKTGNILTGIYIIICLFSLTIIINSIEFILNEVSIYEFIIRSGISIISIIGLLVRSSIVLNIVLWFTGIGIFAQGFVVLLTLGAIDYSDEPFLDIIFNIIIFSLMIWMFKYLNSRRVRIAYNNAR